MKSRKVAITLALVGAGGVLALGLLFQNQAAFSNNYVRTELSSQRIAFSPVANLRPAQQKVPCLVANAGKLLTTGKQAECYAKYQLGIDLINIDHGKTFYEEQMVAFPAKAAAAKAQATDPNAPETLALQQKANQAAQYATSLQQGEEMQGLMLTAFGFSMIGERLAQGAMACFTIAGLLVLVATALATLRRKRPASLSDPEAFRQESGPNDLRPRQDLRTVTIPVKVTAIREEVAASI